MGKNNLRKFYFLLLIFIPFILGNTCDGGGGDEPGTQPRGFIIFYEHPDLDSRGKYFIVGFDNSEGSVKWDRYDFEDIVGNDAISSFEIYVFEPTTLILCEHSHFKGKYARFNVTPAENWYQVRNLGSFNFNDMTSSIIVTNENESESILVDTPVHSIEMIETFRDKAKGKLENIDSKIKSGDLWRTQILWDTKLNVLMRDVFDDDNAVYSDDFKHLKDVDLVHLFQRVDLDIKHWAFNYEVKLRFWVEPGVVNRNMHFWGWAWEYWVEGGVWTNRIADSIEVDMPEILDEIAFTINSEIRRAAFPYDDVIATNIERISFTLPNVNVPDLCNLHAGTGCGKIRSTPPILILQHYQ